MTIIKRGKLDFRKVVLPTIFEYLVIFLPVAFYVGLESMHRGYSYFYQSPEWSIVSIFLGFQSFFLYFRHLNSNNRRPDFNFLGILILGLVVMTFLSALNAYISLDEQHNTISQVILRLILLFFSSICFFLLDSASRI